MPASDHARACVRARWKVLLGARGQAGKPSKVVEEDERVGHRADSPNHLTKTRASTRRA